MRDPSCEEQAWRGLREVCGIEPDVSEEITNMIDGHDHDDHPAKEVDRCDPATGCSEWLHRKGLWVSGLLNGLE